MTTATSPLRSLLTARPRPAAMLDPADMGTCFGLEMTLGAVAAPRPATESRTWWQRLAPQRKAEGT